MNSKLIELYLIEINKLNQSIDRKRYKVKYTVEYYLNFIFYIIIFTFSSYTLLFIIKYKCHLYIKIIKLIYYNII